MTLRQCPWLQPRPWDQSFRLFTLTDDLLVSANHTFSPPELPSLVDFSVDRGPESLLQLLPQHTRKIIGKMLDPNPDFRATIEDLRSDRWYNGILGCQREDYTENSEDESPSGEASGAEGIERLGFGYAILFSKSEE
jgi:serine/threonine protein kinase